MDDATKKMLVNIVAPILRKGLLSAGSALTAHGLMSSNYTEAFVALGMALAGGAWSFWNDYGRAIVLAQLEVLKAKSLAQAAKLQAHDIAPPDAQAVAAASAKSPDMATLSVEDVKKACATLPAAVAGTTALLALFFVALLAAPAFAQAKRPALTGNIINDIRQRTDSSTQVQPGASSDDNSLRKRLLQALAKPFKDISDMIGDDVDNAILLATAIPNLKDGHGQQCWIALRDFTNVSKAHPLPLTGQIATDLQAIRLQAIAANRLCSNIHCTQMFTDYSAMAQAVATAAMGGLGTLGAKALPSLSDACSKIPQIPLIEPLDPVPAAADIKPVGWAGETAPVVETPATPVPAPRPQ